MSGILVVGISVLMLVVMVVVSDPKVRGPSLAQPDYDSYTGLSDEEWAQGRSPKTRGGNQ